MASEGPSTTSHVFSFSLPSLDYPPSLPSFSLLTSLKHLHQEFHAAPPFPAPSTHHHSQFHAKADALDPRSWMSFFTPDAILNYANGPTLTGHEDIIAAMEQSMSGLQSMKHEYAFLAPYLPAPQPLLHRPSLRPLCSRFPVLCSQRSYRGYYCNQV